MLHLSLTLQNMPQLNQLCLVEQRLKLKLFCFIVSGALYPTSMRINEQGRLVVNFRTEARFRGLFVVSHSGEFTPPKHMNAQQEQKKKLNLCRCLMFTYSYKHTYT